MVETIGKKLRLPPEKVPLDILPLYGNLGAASIPALLCEHYAGHPERERDRVMLCAFGAGLALSSCLLSLGGTHFLPVRNYVSLERTLSRNERIAYWHKKFQGD